VNSLSISREVTCYGQQHLKTQSIELIIEFNIYFHSLTIPLRAPDSFFAHHNQHTQHALALMCGNEIDQKRMKFNLINGG
jgi:hypothetical protein